jgi:hypothetical protein
LGVALLSSRQRWFETFRGFASRGSHLYCFDNALP